MGLLRKKLPFFVFKMGRRDESHMSKAFVFLWRPGNHRDRMMTSNIQISNRIREVFLDGKWIANTNFKELLSTIGWQQAIRKVDNLNSIASLTYHVNYYLKGLLNVFSSGNLDIRDKYSFNMPEISDEEDWIELVSELLTNAGLFADQVERLSDHVLSQPFVEERYGSNMRNIEGVVEHSYYHLGQISLIRKLLLYRESKP